MNNSVFRKTMENIQVHRHTKIVTANRRGTCLVSEPNYHTKKSAGNGNEQIVNGLSILDISKIVMYEY